MPGKFVHLHTHTHYSLLDGMSKVGELLDKVKEAGMDACAITDHGVMYGAIEFYQEAKKRGIKPIIGVEAYIAPRKLTDKTAKIDSSPYHLVLLAKNEKGYKNLIKLTTTAHLEGYYYKPRIDKDTLASHSEGLIALSACMSGEVARYLLNDNFTEAAKAARGYELIFGKGSFFLEIQDHIGWKESELLNEKVIKLSKDTGIPLVLTRDSHFTNAQDEEAHDVLLCIQTGKTIGELDRMRMETELSVTGQDEVWERWKDYPEALENTVKIAGMCDLTIELGAIHIPKFDTPEGKSDKDYLRELCFKGLLKRYGKAVEGTEDAEVLKTIPADYAERLDYELSVIEKMRYESYFLVIWDFVSWAKSQGILVGPGRGSAAGSIVSYTLGITDLDPMKYDLLFERFLNPDRISMPDIDMDFADDRRDEVIRYVADKYGRDHVAQIITFGTMMARNALRDTGRALGMSYGEVDRIAKTITPPKQGIKHTPLALQAKINPELKAEYDKDERVRRLVDLAKSLEGVIRHSSTHAAGVVISPKPLIEYVPLQKAVRGSADINQTQYSMVPLEEIGLLKMDFLGLSNLTIIEHALKSIKYLRGEDIDIGEIPLDDQKTFDLLARADTVGVFQLESSGMRRYLKELKPSKIDDIIAMVALYRPGPMQWIDSYVARKNGRQQISYKLPVMEAALKPTYGVMIYQEQVIQIAKEMCGFTGGQADYLRKAIGKKKPKEMAKMKQDFIEGAIATVEAERGVVESFWKELEEFASYCFPKAHAACYGLIAYQTAYLKANYPAEFMAALMTSDYSDVERIAVDIAECVRLGTKVLPPDVNESIARFAVITETNSIRFGLQAIKNIGSGVIESIVSAREKDGKFVSIEDFMKRVDSRELNKKMLESLTKCGALDSLSSRAVLLNNIDKLLDYASKVQHSERSGQIDMFGMMAEESRTRLNLSPAEEVDSRQLLAWEKELLGLYVSEHPLDGYQGFLSANARGIGELANAKPGERTRVGGIITAMRKILTKNQEPMAFATLEDKSGPIELVVFPKVFALRPEVWALDKIIFVDGKIGSDLRDGREEDRKIIVDKVREITSEEALKFKDYAPKELALPSPAAEADPKQMEIVFPSDGTSKLTEIKELLEQNSGKTPVFLMLTQQGKKRRVKLTAQVDTTGTLKEKIEQLLGKGSVVIE